MTWGWVLIALVVGMIVGAIGVLWLVLPSKWDFF